MYDKKNCAFITCTSNVYLCEIYLLYLKWKSKS